MEEVPQSRKGLLKLKGDPVEVDIYTRYELNPDASPDEKEISKKYRPVLADKVTAWMHVLKEDEWIEVEAAGIEAYRSSILRGASRADALWKSNRTQESKQVFLCIRKNGEKGSELLFSNEAEVLVLETMEVDRLIFKYAETFIPSKDELKNSLRERLGKDLEEGSSSPNISETPGLSSLGRSEKRTLTTSKL